MQEGTPDQTYSVLTGDKCENMAILELKSLGVVKGMPPVTRESTPPVSRVARFANDVHHRQRYTGT